MYRACRTAEAGLQVLRESADEEAEPWREGSLGVRVGVGGVGSGRFDEGLAVGRRGEHVGDVDSEPLAAGVEVVVVLAFPLGVLGDPGVAADGLDDRSTSPPGRLGCGLTYLGGGQAANDTVWCSCTWSLAVSPSTTPASVDGPGHG